MWKTAKKMTGLVVWIILAWVFSASAATVRDMAFIANFNQVATDGLSIIHGSGAKIEVHETVVHRMAETPVLEIDSTCTSEADKTGRSIAICLPVQGNKSWASAEGLRLRYTADKIKKLWLALVVITPEGRFKQVVSPFELARIGGFEDRLFAFSMFKSTAGGTLKPEQITEIQIQMAAVNDRLYFDSLSLYEDIRPTSLIRLKTNRDERNLFFPGEPVELTFEPEDPLPEQAGGFVYEIRDFFNTVIVRTEIPLTSGTKQYQRTFNPPVPGYYEVRAFWDIAGRARENSCLKTSGTVPGGLATFAVMPSTPEENIARIKAAGDRMFFGSWGYLSDLAPEYQGFGRRTFEPRIVNMERNGPADRSDGMASWAKTMIQEETVNPDYLRSICHLQANLKKPVWLAKDKEDGVFPPNMKSWAPYAAYVRDTIRVNKALWPSMNPRLYCAAWEINLDAPDKRLRGYAYMPKDVVELHRRMRELINEEDPGALLLGPSCSSPIKHLEWNEPVFKAGILKWVDGYLCHAYHSGPPETAGVVEKFAALRQMMRRFNEGKVLDIYVNEAGYGSVFGTQSLHRQQADWLVRFSLILKGEGCKAYYPFYPIDFSPSGVGLFGFNFNLDKEVESGKHFLARRTSPKPVYPALAACAELTEGSLPVGRLQVLQNGTWGYVFEKDGKPIVAVWQVDRPMALDLPAGAVETVQVFDLMGNGAEHSVSNGLVHLTVSSSPQYILGLSPALYLNNSIAPVDVTPDNLFTINPGETKRIPVDRVKSGRVLGVKILGGLAAKVVSSGILQVSADSSAQPQPCAVQLLVDSSEKSATRKTLWFSVQNAIEIERFGLGVANGAPCAEVDLKNRGAFAVQTEVKLSSEGLPSQKLTAEIAPNSEDSVYLPFPTSAVRPDRLLSTSLSVKTDNGIPLVKTKRFSFLAAQRRGVRASGVLTNQVETSDQMFNVPLRSGDVGTLTFEWDEANLYVCAEVHDKVYAQNERESLMWKEDSIQLAFDTDPELSAVYDLVTSIFTKKITSIMISRSGDKVTVWRLLTHNERELPTGNVSGNGIQAEVLRDEKTKITSYRITIPWKEIGLNSVERGKEIGIAVLVNDSDGPGTERKVSGLFEGIMYSGGYRKFGSIVLQ